MRMFRHWTTLRRALLVSSALAALVMLSGCDLPDEPSRSGPSVITFDGIYLGSKDSVGTEYPEVRCLGDGRPHTIVPKDRSLGAYQGDWRPYGRWDEPQVRMRLELSDPGLDAPRIEFSIGDAVYRSDRSTALRVNTGWDGDAIFERVPLVSGTPYAGLRLLRRLSVDWDCWVKD